LNLFRTSCLGFEWQDGFHAIPRSRFLKLFGVSFVWPKASIIVAWGETPGNSNEMHVLAEGHIHIGTVDDVNMAFGQTIPDAPNSWGGAPGYGENRPSAKRFVANAQLHNSRFGLRFVRLVPCSPCRPWFL
jgi:hypothetical protein